MIFAMKKIPSWKKPNNISLFRDSLSTFRYRSHSIWLNCNQESTGIDLLLRYKYSICRRNISNCYEIFARLFLEFTRTTWWLRILWDWPAKTRKYWRWETN
jgi:hypothetical protein